MIEDAFAEFDRAMVNPRNLVEIHKALNKGPGLRVREMSLNRGIVVLTVAAWQAFLEDLVDEVLDAIAISSGDVGYDHYRILRIDAKRAARFFSTPNAEKTRELLFMVGLDPWPHWRWQSGPEYVSETTARERLNQWLQVRHAIAHGDDTLPDVSVLTALTSGRRSLERWNAERCMRFFTKLAEKTTAAAVDEFV